MTFLVICEKAEPVERLSHESISSVAWSGLVFLSMKSPVQAAEVSSPAKAAIRMLLAIFIKPYD